MKRHMGIGRRLAPLLDNDRRTAELLYALILSLPGSPVIYYGDELLMGDNIYLGDRDSVRTPMQWSPDRNGGFSKADFAQLYLPPLMDPVYGFDALNVEAQLRNQGSFLHWLRRMLTERRALPVMGVGEMEVLPCANPSVLAYVRSGEVADILSSSATTGPPVRPSVDGALDWGRATVLARTVPAGNESEGDEVVHRHQAVLCVHNLSRFAQPAELALAKWAGFDALRGAGTGPLPGHHRGALHDHAAAVRLLVVRPGSRGEAGPANDRRARPGAAHARRGVAGAAAGRADGCRSTSSVPRCSGPAAPACSTSWPGWGSGGRTWWRACAAWRTSPTSCAPGKRPRSACSTTSTVSPSAPMRCATPQLAPLLLATVRGVETRARAGGRPPRRRRRHGRSTAATGATSSCSRGSGTRRGPTSTSWSALDEAGFNHVAAPLVRWAWEGRDLGVVQEPLADRSGGWALALTSLRDFYAAGGSPEAAGGDFGAEARALGTMTARMHLALDRAFLRHHEPVVDWVDEAEASIAAADPSLLEAPGVAELVKWIRESEVRLPVIRTHGDFQSRADGAHRPGMGGQRLRAGWCPAPADPHPAGARPWRRGRPAVVDAPGQHGRPRRSGTRRAGSVSPRSARPGRRGTDGPSWRATWARPASGAWSGPTATWCGGWCRCSSSPARCRQP